MLLIKQPCSCGKIYYRAYVNVANEIKCPWCNKELSCADIQNSSLINYADLYRPTIMDINEWVGI